MTMTSTTPNTGYDTESTPEPTTSETWIEQLQRMIDEVSRAAVPVMREVAAKAAELAAVAGEKAGPLAYKAAVKTQEIGTMVAEKGKVMAADLRRAGTEAAANMNGNGHSAETVATEPAAEETPAEPATSA
jgi:hypothetical protein